MTEEKETQVEETKNELVEKSQETKTNSEEVPDVKAPKKKTIKKKVAKKKEKSTKEPSKKENKKDMTDFVKNLEGLALHELKSKLDELNKNKEEWFKRKEDLKQEIANMIEEAKKIRINKDDFTKKVDELKKKRNKFNKDVQEMVTKIKDLNKQKQDKFFKLGMDKTNFGALKSKLEKLELDLETQAVSFDKEKKFMKEINSIKKKLSSMSEVNLVIEGIDDISKKINDAKSKGDEFHNKIKDYIRDHKSDYKHFTKLSKEINKLKKVQEDAFEKFIDFKQEFVEANKVLKEKFGDIHEKKRKDRRKREEKQKAKKDKVDKQISDRVEEVEEKLKKKKVLLTNEDLIAFQAKKE